MWGGEGMKKLLTVKLEEMTESVMTTAEVTQIAISLPEEPTQHEIESAFDSFLMLAGYSPRVVRVSEKDWRKAMKK